MKKYISYCECPSQKSWRGSQTFSVHRTLSVSVIFPWCPQAPKNTYQFHSLDPYNLVSNCVLTT